MTEVAVSGSPSWHNRIVPSRWHWLSLLCGPTSYPLLLSVIAVVLAKLSVLSRLQGVEAGLLESLGLVASDVTLHLSLIALFTLGEGRSRRLLLATLPLAFLVSALATINALYLQISGEQLTLEAFTIGVELSREVLGILGEQRLFSFKNILGLVVIISLPAIALRLLRNSNQPLAPQRQQGRAKAAAWILVPALLLTLVSAEPTLVPLRALQGNATWNTYTSWLASIDDEPVGGQSMVFQGYEPVFLASSDEIASVSGTARPNVVVVILESVRWDYTSLYNPKSAAYTPNLEALGSRGTVAQRARAVMPHTTKSVFSMLCGRLPMMQRKNYEVGTNDAIQCLPGLLGEAGYDTYFMQTALGAFEDRPRLVERLGFKNYKAWESIQGEPAGYLSSDDESLVPAMAQLLENRNKEKPFFVTMLTSATHHPYRLVGKAKARVRESKAPAYTDQERYARLIEAQDFMLGEILEDLEKRGLTESTIVVVLGDHGEGFGDKGIRQHDNNPYEEGVRVPLVVVGPNVPKTVVARNVSLVDLTPTLMELVGFSSQTLEVKALPGRSIYSDDNDGRLRPFACYFDGYCYGFVQGTHKIVYSQGSVSPWYFDLEADPDELKALSLTKEMERSGEILFQMIGKHRNEAPIEKSPLKAALGKWSCPQGERCQHPNSPKTYFFRNNEGSKSNSLEGPWRP